MSHPSKVKGSRFERDVVEYLRSHGWPHAERQYGAGRPDDRGDVAGLPGFVIECKAAKRVELSKFVDEAIAEANNALAPYPVVVAKRPQRPISDAYVVMTLRDWCALVAELEGVAP